MVDGRYQHSCSGSIISSKIIVTAAHCTVNSSSNKFNRFFPQSVVVNISNNNFSRETASVRAGVLNLKYAEDAVNRKIARALRHPDYSGTYWDVALLYLDEPLPISNSIQPISLPLQSQPDPGSLTRVGITSQGWGYNEDGKLGEGLEKIEVSVRSKSECDFMYSNNLSRLDKLRVRKFLPDLVSSSLFCADNNLDQRIGTCNGDSGGPSVIRYSHSSLSLS